MPLPYEANTTCIGTFVAGEDLTGHQYKAVALSTSADDTVVKPSGQGAMCIGILQNAPKQGAQASVCIHGVSQFIGGDTVTRGTRVTANAADGEIGAAGSGDYVLGVITQSVTDGATASMLVTPHYIPLA